VAVAICFAVAAGWTLESDKQALLQFFNATGGATWVNQTGWDAPSSDPCVDGWFGIQDFGPGDVAFPSLIPTTIRACSGSVADHNQRVQVLAVTGLFHWTDNGIKGELPAEPFITLDALRVLFFYRINSAGRTDSRLPATIVRLPRLEVLSCIHCGLVGDAPDVPATMAVVQLQNNRLNGTIPATLSQATGLREYEVFGQFKQLGSAPSPTPYAGLVGTLPNLALLTDLEVLHVNNNRIGGSIKGLGKLAQLRTLDVHGNRFTGTILRITAPDLTLLDASDNQFTAFELPAASPKLHTIKLGSNSITGTISPLILKASQLSFLDLSRNFMHGTIPSALAELGGLTQLLLSGNSFNGTLPAKLFGPESRLTALNAEHNAFVGTLPRTIGAVNLASFLMSGNFLEGEVPDFSACRTLAYISLAGNRLRGELPLDWPGQLQVLLLNQNMLSGKIPVRLLANLISLNQLDVSDNQLTGGISLGNATDDSRQCACSFGTVQLDTYYDDLSNFFGVSSFVTQGEALRQCTFLSTCTAVTAASIPSDRPYSLRGGTVPRSSPSNEHSIAKGNCTIGCSNRTFPLLQVLDVSRNKISGRIPDFSARWPLLLNCSANLNYFSCPAPKLANQFVEGSELLDILTGNLFPCPIGNVQHFDAGGASYICARDRLTIPFAMAVASIAVCWLAFHKLCVPVRSKGALDLNNEHEVCVISLAFVNHTCWGACCLAFAFVPFYALSDSVYECRSYLAVAPLFLDDRGVFLSLLLVAGPFAATSFMLKSILRWVAKSKVSQSRHARRTVLVTGRPSSAIVQLASRMFVLNGSEWHLVGGDGDLSLSTAQSRGSLSVVVCKDEPTAKAAIDGSSAGCSVTPAVAPNLICMGEQALKSAMWRSERKHLLYKTVLVAITIILNILPNLAFVYIEGRPFSKVTKYISQVVVALVKSLNNSVVDPYVARLCSKFPPSPDRVTTFSRTLAFLLPMMLINTLLVPMMTVALLNERCLYFWWHAQEPREVAMTRYSCSSAAYATEAACKTARWQWKRKQYELKLPVPSFKWDNSCPDVMINVYSPLYMTMLLQLGCIFPAVELFKGTATGQKLLQKVYSRLPFCSNTPQDMADYMPRIYAQALCILVLVVTVGWWDPLLMAVGTVAFWCYRRLRLKEMSNILASGMWKDGGAPWLPVWCMANVIYVQVATACMFLFFGSLGYGKYASYVLFTSTLATTAVVRWQQHRPLGQLAAHGPALTAGSESCTEPLMADGSVNAIDALFSIPQQAITALNAQLAAERLERKVLE
jgi:Leucine-rich repeat (LRR) protein